jgi:transcriptional regulator with GAF, ATPase, and Fis domain
VLAATNQDLAAMMEAKRFREDLYYRLISFPIRTPALRDHPEDIPLMAAHFWSEIRSVRERLPDEVAAVLQAYPWRGNARELRGFLGYVSALASRRAPGLRLVRRAFSEWTGVWPGHRDR